MNADASKMIRRLSIGCLYLLVRKAIPDFPGSTRASPSQIVFVSLAWGEPLRTEDRIQFPMKMPWYIWHRVVIPILTVTNPGTDPTNIGSGSVPDPVTGACYDLGVEIKTTLRTSLRIEGNIYQMGLRDYEPLLVKLDRMITMMMVDQGFLPAGIINT